MKQTPQFTANLVSRTGLLLVIGAVGLASATGCGSDDDSSGGGAGKANAGAGGKASAAGAGGKASAGSPGGGADNAGSPDEGVAGSSEPEPTGDAGASGAAGEGNQPEPFTAHLSPTGAVTKIVSITPGGHDRFYNVTFDADDNIYAVGVTAPSFATTADFATVVAKFSPAGVLDTTFGDGGYAIRNVAVGAAGELARGIGIQPDGKIVISTSIEHVAAGADARDRDIALLRYLPNGKKDTSFGDDGVVTINLTDGKLVGTAFLVESVWGFALYPDGRIVLSAGELSAAGTDTDFAIIRRTKDGAPDATFGTGGVVYVDTLVGDTAVSNNASPRNLALLPGTQGIIGGGYQPVPGFDTKPAVYHITDAGKLDKAFGVDGVFSEAVFEEQTETYIATPQSTGKLVTTGYARALSTDATDILSLRLSADGKRDLTYGDAGVVKLDIGGFADNSRNLVVLPNDHIVLVGGGRPVADNVDGVVVALDENGKPETTFSDTGWKTFDLGGPADFLWGAGLSPSHKTLVACGIKGAGAAAGAMDDDAALVILKLVP